MPATILIILAAFFTSILSGMFGMAGGLIFMGILAWMLPVTAALALHGIIQFASNIWRALLYRMHVAWRVFLWFGLGSLFAIGFFSLIVIEQTKFYVFLGLGLMPILVWLPEHWIRLDAANRWHAIGGGFASTGLSLVSGVSGPVTDMLFIHTTLTRHQIVATKSVMQAIGHAAKILVYGAILLSASARESVSLPVTIGAILSSMAGIMAGGYILNCMTDAHFRAGRKWIVTLIGGAFLVRAAQIAWY